MAKDKEDFFVDPEKISVIIPYSYLEKMAFMVQKFDAMEKQYKHMEEMYTAIYGMWHDCLKKIGEIEKYVTD